MIYKSTYATAYQVDNLEQLDCHVPGYSPLKHFEDGKHTMRRDKLDLHFRGFFHDAHLRSTIT